MRTHLKMIGGGEVAFDAILSFESVSKRTQVNYVVDGELHIQYSRDSLKGLEAEYSDQVLRTHRDSLMPVAHIDNMRPTKHKTIVLRAEIQDVRRHLAISRRELPNVKRVVGELLRARNVSSSDT